MLNFENIEDFVSHMFANLDNENNLVSVIANKHLATGIMVELLSYKNVFLDSCEIDYEEEYDKEYIVSLFDDAESDNWYVNVEKCYLPEKEKYYAAPLCGRNPTWRSSFVPNSLSFLHPV